MITIRTIVWAYFFAMVISFAVKRRITRGGFGTLISAISPPGRRVRIGGDILWAA